MLDDKCQRMQQAFCDSFRRIFPEHDRSLIEERFQGLLEEVLFLKGGNDLNNKKTDIEINKNSDTNNVH